MGLEDLRKDLEIVNAIDWNMTPEEAVTLYLEWGNNWSHGKNLVRSKNDVSFYFVVDTWQGRPDIRLIRRNSEGAMELAHLQAPEDMAVRFMESVAQRKGIYPLNEELKTWLQGALQATGN